jgi:hypothetical protein
MEPITMKKNKAPHSASEAPLPHERDQDHHDVGPDKEGVIEQARQDIESGQMDTDLRGMRGLDQIKKPGRHQRP